ncbi:MAG: hypothetical protein ACK559_08720, partial [bacterium]
MVRPSRIAWCSSSMVASSTWKGRWASLGGVTADPVRRLRETGAYRRDRRDVTGAARVAVLPCRRSVAVATSIRRPWMPTPAPSNAPRLLAALGPALLATIAAPAAAQGQAWPAKPLRLIQGFPAGSTVDVL